ncbi:hypothetical protein CCGE532_30175 (plasmid) [Rhizobium sp. CCGE532]|nr:hypothetical protein CCGE532_30175 [Rhizobium sp. CCGE532]
MVVTDGQLRSVEVKTRQFLRRPTEITRWPMDMETKGVADFFIFIELDLRTMSPTFFVLTNAQARATFRDYIGGGNCYPPEVRKLIRPNDFSALAPSASSTAIATEIPSGTYVYPNGGNLMKIYRAEFGDTKYKDIPLTGDDIGEMKEEACEAMRGSAIKARSRPSWPPCLTKTIT